jgi:DNA-binding transcriptional MerR regulator
LELINKQELPVIPAKRYFTIGEVAALCLVKPHVLRYWEAEFPQLKPVKRAGNRRYYQYDEIILVRQIKNLLYEQGYTIGGARLKMAERNASSTKERSSSKNNPLADIVKDLDNLIKSL